MCLVKSGLVIYSHFPTSEIKRNACMVKTNVTLIQMLQTLLTTTNSVVVLHFTLLKFMQQLSVAVQFHILYGITDHVHVHEVA